MRCLANDELVKHYSDLVDIASLTDALLFQHLRREVGRRATEGTSALTLVDVLLSQSKVGEAAVALGIDEHVFRLEVTVNCIELV